MPFAPPGINWVGAAAVLLGARLLEAIWGEPPNRIHPVAWFGHLAGRVTAWMPPTFSTQLVYGAALALVLPTLAAGATFALLTLAQPWPVLEGVLATVLLRYTFALRALEEAARAVSSALEAEALDQARKGLRSLCSREASNLSADEVAGAATESVAENLSDSFVAPLFYFALLGVPGAVFYRGVNTLDAMIGYRGRFEALGKASARLDDALNLVPARLTAVVLSMAHPRAAHRGWRVLWRDAAQTDSPNAGWPMAMMAGLLGVRLTKREQYALGDATQPNTAHTLTQACAIARRAGHVFLAAVGVTLGARWGWG